MEAAFTTVGGAILSASFEALFQSLGSHVLLKYARQGHVVDQLNKWESMWQTIFLVLEDAEEKQMAVPSVKKWFSELRDLDYDVEDILDEFATDQALRRQRLELASTTSMVRKFVPTCCVRLNLSPDKFNAEMISKINRITARLDDIVKQKNFLLLGEIGRGNTSQIRERLPTTSVLEVNEAKIYGREKDKMAILELLKAEASDVEVYVLPIAGMGGVGKTTLSQLIFSDTSLEFDFKAWVCVGEDFDVLRITKTILQSDSSDEKKDLNWHQMKLKEKRHQKKCLIVLDDVWNENYSRWTLFCGPLQGWGPGSRIIVTTRNESVSRMVGYILPYPLKELSSDECLSVFAQHALGEVNFDKHLDLEEIGKEIVKRCQGLPLAAKALGGLLRGSLNHKTWEEVLNSNIWDLPDDKCDILPALRLSYFHLPSHLKQCFAYCAIFPKDFEFNRNELVLLWMAEGFVNQLDKMLELGCQYFDELLSKSFFQVSSSNKSRYVMHDLIHDLAQFVSGETCFHLGDKQENTNLHAKIRHSSFNSDDYGTWKKFKVFLEMKNLRTFLALAIIEVYGLKYLTNKVFHDMVPKSLRVLSLAGYHIVELPSSIGTLKQLRYLNVSHTEIGRLPETVGDLLNLQTLRLRGCYNVTELPAGIGNLINLYCLDISECENLSKLPSGMSNLTNLQCLDVSDVNQLQKMPPKIGNLRNLNPLTVFTMREDNRLKLTELKKYSKLQGKLCVRELQNVVDMRDVKISELKEKHEIEELELEWSENSRNSSDEEVEVLNSLRPHQNLSRLSIHGFSGSEISSWTVDPMFKKMMELGLWECRNITLLPPLGQIPSLRVLNMGGMQRGKEVGVELYGDGSSCFTSLETLMIRDMEEWEQWTHISNDLDEEAAVKFPKLGHLQIINCPKLVGKLPGCLPSLRNLWIESCQAALLRSMSNFTSLTCLDIQEISGLVSLDEVHIEDMVALQDLKIEDCDELRRLWKDETNIDKLSSLKRLHVMRCNELVSLIAGEEGKLPCNLQVLSIVYCDNLEMLANGLHRLTFLRDLNISSCNKLKSFPARGVPRSLRKLYIQFCSSLECIPEGVIDNQMNSQLEELEIWACPSLISCPNRQFPNSLLSIKCCGWSTQLLECLYTTLALADSLPNGFSHLTKLEIKLCPQLEYFREECGLSFHTLTSFSIYECKNLWILPSNLSSLQSLNVSGCKNIRSLPNEMRNLTSLGLQSCDCLESLPSNLSSLQSLNIDSCNNLRSLPNGMRNLSSLRLGWCKGLESLGEVGFASNLTDLYICDCKNLKQPMSEWGLHSMTSLTKLEMCGTFPSIDKDSFPSIDKDSFPYNDSLLPSSLTTICIMDFKNLKFISKAILNLTSLTVLHFLSCPSLQSFPVEGLPPTLEDLWIYSCPLLEEWCSKHWSIIFHIPSIHC